MEEARVRGRKWRNRGGTHRNRYWLVGAKIPDELHVQAPRAHGTCRREEEATECFKGRDEAVRGKARTHFWNSSELR